MKPDPLPEGEQRADCWLAEYPNGAVVTYGHYPINLEKHSLATITVATWRVANAR